eukprot:TRINITY_DN4647_c0_g1_i1.p1 TRINITY_DN4647_c0_g1~~TRINITY_DN4647_c0_g1_i1.p1  ORF type:complete len:432 (+),score=98.24 TRINITY_DN4647_c0_g1_i1:76-1371(+)
MDFNKPSQLIRNVIDMKPALPHPHKDSTEYDYGINERQDGEIQSSLLECLPHCEKEFVQHLIPKSDHKDGEAGYKLVGACSDDHETGTFYNKLERNRSSREKSQIAKMRKYNNFMKACQIKEFCETDTRPHSILDLACGKGGDIQKWKLVNPEIYVGIDIAFESLEGYIERTKGGRDQFGRSRDPTRVARDKFILIEASLGTENPYYTDVRYYMPGVSEWSYGRPLPSTKFDAISMQFALHYMFESKEKCDGFFSFIREALGDNGVFFGITVDANKLVSLLSKFYPEKTAKIFTSSGNLVCSAEFGDEAFDRIFNPERANDSLDSLYGLRYMFQLLDSNDEQSVGAPEYLIPRELLEDTCRRHGLILQETQNIQTVFEKSVNRYPKVFEDMMYMAVDTNKGLNQFVLNQYDWEVSGLYTTFEIRVDTMDFS